MLDIILYYDNYTSKFYIQIMRGHDKIIHKKFDTEQQSMNYLIDYCEKIHTALIRK